MERAAVLSGTGPVLVLAPHPDDEVLGAGGTIARLASQGRDVHVVIVTKGGPPLFEEDFIERGRAEAREAHDVLLKRRMKTAPSASVRFPAEACPAPGESASCAASDPRSTSAVGHEK